MIHITDQPISIEEQKRMRDWLVTSESFAFRRHIANLAAKAAADAGNLMATRPNETAPEEAIQKAEQARFYTRVIHLLNELSAPGYQFHQSTLQPNPVTNVSTAT